MISQHLGMDLNLKQRQPLNSNLFSHMQKPDPWNTHVWKGVNGTPTKKRAIGFKKLAK